MAFGVADLVEAVSFLFDGDGAFVKINAVPDKAADFRATHSGKDQRGDESAVTV